MLNTANQHAANADEFIARGLFIPASLEHRRAADAYTAALERCSDEHTKQTLRKLHDNHLKAALELDRKIEKLRQENKDPSLPQKQQNIPLNPPQPFPLPSPPPPTRRMTDSQGTGDESFMVLGQRSDPGDAFNHFWKIMEGMLDNLSQPVAFATAPLHSALQRNGSLSSDTDLEEPTPGRKLPKPPAHLGDEDFVEDIFDQGDDLSESFCLVPPSNPSPLSASSYPPQPSSSRIPPPTNIATLQAENSALKADMEAMQKRIVATERVLQLRKDQDQQLRDSIYMARREAQRAMGASAMFPLANQNLNVNPGTGAVPPTNGGREAQFIRRIRELEEEVRVLKADGEKQKAMIAKFRERWDKLKESAKKKKDAKAAAVPGGVMEPVISEEPEVEDQADS